jgi:hypothetical protein
VQADRGAALAFGDRAGLEVGEQVLVVDAIRNLMVTGTRSAARTAARTIARSSFALERIAAPPPRG